MLTELQDNRCSCSRWPSYASIHSHTQPNSWWNYSYSASRIVLLSCSSLFGQIRIVTRFHVQFAYLLKFLLTGPL